MYSALNEAWKAKSLKNCRNWDERLEFEWVLVSIKLLDRYLMSF